MAKEEVDLLLHHQSEPFVHDVDDGRGDEDDRRPSASSMSTLSLVFDHIGSLDAKTAFYSRPNPLSR